MPLYSAPSSYLLTSAPKSIKLNNVPLIIPNLLLKYESNMMLILLKQITFNWLVMFLLYFRKSTCTTYRETVGSCFLNALWFIMCGHCATNILLSKICLLFFTMFDSVGLYAIDRLSITSGNTTPYFQASSTFPIYISWLWCTPVMYTMICLVVVCSCYHGLAINSLYSIL